MQCLLQKRTSERVASVFNAIHHKGDILLIRTCCDFCVSFVYQHCHEQSTCCIILWIFWQSILLTINNSTKLHWHLSFYKFDIIYISKIKRKNNFFLLYIALLECVVQLLLDQFVTCCLKREPSASRDDLHGSECGQRDRNSDCLGNSPNIISGLIALQSGFFLFYWQNIKQCCLIFEHIDVPVSN